MFRWMVILVSLTVLSAVLAACGGGGQPQPAEGVAPDQPGAELQAVLPGLAEVPRQGSANAVQRLRKGAEYVPGLKSNAGTQGISMVFEPEYNGVDQFAPAWAVYEFYLPDYSDGGQMSVVLNDNFAAPDDGTVWLGLSDWGADSWAWYPVDTGQEPPQVEVEVTGVPVSDYIDGSGRLLACLTCVGSAPVVIAAVLAGESLAPVAVPMVLDSLTEDDTVSTLTGSFSFSEFATITAWDWDLDSDGTYDESGAIVDAVAFSAGEHDVTLRVTDSIGHTATAVAHVIAMDADNLPDYAEQEDNDSLATAQQLPAIPFSDFFGNAGPGGVHGDGQDYYEFMMYADGMFNAALWYAAFEADLGLAVLDQYGSVLADKDVPGNNEWISVQLRAGRHYLLVYSSTGETGGTDYELEVFQPLNNEAPVAYLTMVPKTLALGDEVTLYANQSYDFDGTIDEYQWDLYGDGDFERTTTESSTTYTVDRAGEFTAVVRAVDNNGAWGEYAVQFTVSGDQVFDEVEDNDSRAEAMDLSWFPLSGTPSFTGEVGPGGANDGDAVDIFSFQLAEPGTVQWILNTVDAEHAELEIELVYVTGDISNSMAIDDSGNPVLAISEALTGTIGTYYMYVTPTAGAGRYDFSLHFIAN